MTEHKADGGSVQLVCLL